MKSTVGWQQVGNAVLAIRSASSLLDVQGKSFETMTQIKGPFKSFSRIWRSTYSTGVSLAGEPSGSGLSHSWAGDQDPYVISLLLQISWLLVYKLLTFSSLFAPSSWFPPCLKRASCPQQQLGELLQFLHRLRSLWASACSLPRDCAERGLNVLIYTHLRPGTKTNPRATSRTMLIHRHLTMPQKTRAQRVHFRRDQNLRVSETTGMAHSSILVSNR
jgi:hypothetical protein